MKDAMILDVDGTLCDVSSVLHHVNLKDPRNSGKKRFDLFHKESIDCPPHPFALDLYDFGVSLNFAPIVLTGRMEEWREVTTQWLEKYDITFDRLYMRPQGDFRPAQEIKLEILDTLRQDGFEVKLVVEDAPDNVEMFRAQGLQVVQVPTWEGSY